MSNTFDITRFERLFVKHTVEHFRSYLMSALVLTGLLTAVYIFFSPLRGGEISPGLRFSLATLFYLLGGCIFTSSIFVGFTQKNRAIDALILPASHFEKFLVGWIYSYIIYTLVFSVSFGLVDFCITRLGTAAIQKPSFIEAAPERGILILFLTYSLLQSLALFGSVYFNKLHFVKTALCFFAIICVVSLFHYFVLQILFPDNGVVFNTPFMASALSFDNGSLLFEQVRLEQSEKSLYTVIMVAGVTLTLWTSSFFQIKEKQI